MVRNVKYTTVSVDAAVANGFLLIAYHDGAYASGGGDNGVQYVIYNSTDMRLVSSGTLAVSGATNVKVVAVGTTILVFFATTVGNVVTCARFTGGSSFAGSGTTVAPAAGRAFAFDVAANDSSTCLLAYESTATNLKWGTVDTAGTFTSKQDQVTANPSRPSICLATNGNVAMCWAEGATFDVGDLHYLVSTTAGTPVTAKTTLDSSGLVTGFPTAGAVPSTFNWAFCWNRSDGKISYGSTSATNLSSTWAFVSRPFAGPNSGALAWVANHSASSDTSGAATYSLFDVAATVARVETIACQTLAQPGAWLTTSPATHTHIENRRNAGFALPTELVAPSSTALGVVLPVLAGGVFGADLVRSDSSAWADIGMSARINGQLVFAGPRVHEYDGIGLRETGLGEGPEIVTATDAGAGSIEGGTRQYVVTQEFFDGLGRRHRSPPSLPVSLTIGASRTVTVAASTPNVSDRASYFRVWRTVADGTVFYLVAESGALATPGLGTLTALTDNTTDAAIIDNEVLYTQGARGGLSGLLQNDEPPPCRFIWAGNNRVILGGLEQGSQVQWSKLIFPGEPLQFANNDAFRATVDADVSGVAALDGTWYVGSRESIWAFQGDGPDDTGAGGTFGEPRRLPSDVGFYSQRSILEIPQGLLFQGRPDRMYLLPRGGGAPQWIGQAVRDTLAAFPFISAAKLIQDENVAVFTCLNTAGTDGRILVYDTRIGEWTIDIPFNGASNSTRAFRCLDVYNGKVVLDGQIAETAAYADDESGSQNRAIIGTLVTGDMRPFGALGHGRMLKLVVLSEYRSATTFTIEESLDGGVTWQSPAASYTPSNSAGDTVKVSYDLPVIRGEAYRFRIISTPTSPGEGMVFNAMTAEIYPSQGTPRLANAYRA